MQLQECSRRAQTVTTGHAARRTTWFVVDPNSAIIDRTTPAHPHHDQIDRAFFRHSQDLEVGPAERDGVGNPLPASTCGVHFFKRMDLRVAPPLLQISHSPRQLRPGLDRLDDVQRRDGRIGAISQGEREIHRVF